jgi:ParB-like chromosome segregation protein Spo0J
MNMHRESFAPDEIVIPARLRTTLDGDAVQGLADSIGKIGLRHPITVRWDKDGDEDVIVLVAGRHRLEACKRLGIQLIECTVFPGTETEARLWEIAENLHRAHLTVQERAEHIAEWVRLTAEKSSAQVAPVKSRRADGRGGPVGEGINAAVRDLGIDRTEAQRAIKIANLEPEVKETVRGTPIADNQSALLRVAKETSATAQLAAVRRENDLEEARKANRRTDAVVKDRRIEVVKEWLAGRLDVNEMHELGGMLAGICDPLSRALMREAA